MSTDYFESEEALGEYLFAQYGTPEQRCPQNPGAFKIAGSIVDFVTESLHHLSLQLRGRALDLGCAPGRSTFELRRFFDNVVGIDRSRAFVSAAERIQRQREITTTRQQIFGSTEPTRLVLPSRLVTDNVTFKAGDACNLDPDLGVFDLVMLTQLIDRVADPARCLRQLVAFVNPEGWLVIGTACNWREKFTPRDKWLVKGETGIVDDAKDILAPFFNLHHHFHLQYFIRERPYGYEWSIVEISLWQRSSVTCSTPNSPP